MTTAADRKHIGNERGQSVLEFLMVLPLMVGFFLILLRVNMAMQVSIVNQQYARAQALFLAYNSSVYPELRLQNSALNEKRYNQMIIGVSDNTPPDDAGGKYQPRATTQNISQKKVGGSEEAHQEPERRADVRIRNTVTLCTQTNVIDASGSYKPMIDLTGDPRSLRVAGLSRLSEGTLFDYCHYPQGAYK